MTLIDISMPLTGSIPVWPESAGVARRLFKSIEDGDPVNASHLELDVHCGTHLDAPLHFLESGLAIDQVPLGKLTGPAWIVDCGDSPVVRRKQLEQSGIPASTRRLLLKTTNSALAINRGAEFSENYCALAPDAADWVVEMGIELIGIDYLSIQCFHDPPDVHLKLLEAEVAILEGLLMGAAPEGPCELICLPLLIPGAEAAPARAVIRVP